MADKEVRLIDACKIETFLRQMRYAAATHGKDYDAMIIGIILETVEHEPTIEAEPVKHGRWENGHCTHCGEDVASKLDTWTDVQNFIYCPNCGSKNEDGDSDE